MMIIIVMCIAATGLNLCLGKRQTRTGRNCARRLGVVLTLLAMFLMLGACSKAEPADPGQTQEPTEAEDNAPAEQDEAPAEQENPPSPEPEQEESSGEAEPEEEPVEEPAQSEGDDWKLILVNAGHPLPEDYSITLKELRNDQWVDERIYPELQQMFDDARAEGIYPLINESYRTAERQQEILDGYIESYQANGLSEEEAVAQAMEIAASPGTSEHQLGLAVDIISETDEDDTPTWQWLEANCSRYGFILRYPEDKTEITGISYEPWHFRYVGKEAAEEIMERGITLEEYLEGE